MSQDLTNLKNTLISDAALEAFTATLMPLTALALNVSPSPLDRGDKVKVLSIPAADAAIDFPGTYGTQDTDASGLDVTIDKHKVVDWSFTDIELSTQPQIELEKFGRQKGFQLAKAVLVDIFSLITNANYGAAAFVGAASGFDADDVVDISKVCDDASWDEQGRSLVLASAYHASLRKDNALQDASAFGADSVIRKGMVPSLDTFEAIFKSTIIPSNSENLVGFAVLSDAILVAMRYLRPQEGHNYIRAEAVTDPETGFTMGFREFYAESTGKKTCVLEANYGYLKGNAAALKRITSA